MAVPAARLWWGLTDPEALPRWLGILTSGRLVTGNVVTIEHAENYSCTSRIQECRPGQLLSMTWKFPDEANSHVRIALSPAGETTSLELEHEELGREAVNYLPGWHTHLLYLEALLLEQPRPMDEFWSTYESFAQS
ncbi:hypothetical protein GCM10027404_32560 [Arthrobacter tumbae]